MIYYKQFKAIAIAKNKCGLQAARRNCVGCIRRVQLTSGFNTINTTHAECRLHLAWVFVLLKGANIMENKLTVFNNENFGEVRVVEINGEPWFVAADVCRALELGNPSQSIARLDEDEKALISIEGLSRGNDKGNVVNEPGLYSLVLGSRKPEAKMFKRWITHEVIPAIRKHGGYLTISDKDDDMAIFYRALHLAEQRMKEREARLKEQEELIEAQAEMIDAYKPKVEYCDTILQSENSMTVTQIAMDYGLTAQRLNSILCESKVQRRVGKQWVVNKRYLNEGYVDSCTVYFRRKSGDMDSTTYTKWTQQGRLFIHNLLSDRGIIPLMDRE